MRFGPCGIKERVLRVEPENGAEMSAWCFLGGWETPAAATHHFSATMPFGVRPRIYSLPLPTRPKFADAATAMRESKKGEYLTL